MLRKNLGHNCLQVLAQVKGMQAVEFKEGESDVFEFEVQAEDDNVETYSEAEVEELKNTISDLQTKIAQFKEDAKKQETIKSLKSQLKGQLAEAKSKYKHLDTEAAGLILLIRSLLNPFEDDTTKIDVEKANVQFQRLQEIVLELRTLKEKIQKLEDYFD